MKNTIHHGIAEVRFAKPIDTFCQHSRCHVNLLVYIMCKVHVQHAYNVYPTLILQCGFTVLLLNILTKGGFLKQWGERYHRTAKLIDRNEFTTPWLNNKM